MTDFVRFEIHCGTCGQRLAVVGAGDGQQIYGHENSSDCSDGARTVVVPEVSVEQLLALFQVKKSVKKAASKKSSKK